MANEINYNNVEETQDPMAQEILNNVLSGREEFEEADPDIDLPSNEDDGDVDDNNQEENKLYANKYKSIDELKKGIKNIGSDLDDDILDGMSEDSLEKYYMKLNANKSKGNKKFAIDDEAKKDDDSDNKPSNKPKEASAIPQELWTELDSTFAEKGGITQSQYEQLEKLGIPSTIVDNYLDGLVAKQQTRVNMIYEVAGGEEQFNTIKAWAENGGIDRDYIDSLGTMNDNQLKTALKLIKTQYEIENGKKSISRVVGNKSTGSNNGAYRSMDEYMKDVNDKRYSYDDAFRRAVDRKLANSKLA